MDRDVRTQGDPTFRTRRAYRRTPATTPGRANGEHDPLPLSAGLKRGRSCPSAAQDQELRMFQVGRAMCEVPRPYGIDVRHVKSGPIAQEA